MKWKLVHGLLIKNTFQRSSGCARCYSIRKINYLFPSNPSILPLSSFPVVSLPQSTCRYRATQYPVFTDMSSIPQPVSQNWDTESGTIRSIFYRAVTSVLPSKMMEGVLKYNDQDNTVVVEDIEYVLNRNLYVVGFGKAVLGMARAVDDILHPHIVAGVLSVPLGSQKFLADAGKSDLLLSKNSKIEVLEGAENNLPDEDASKAAKKILEISRKLKQSDILIVLVSGGGSALLPLPHPPVSITDMVQLTTTLSKNGANIDHLNIVRKHVEILKGGGLAQAAKPAKVITLILSDVIGDKLDIISSGPTVYDMSSVQMCNDIFRNLGVEKQVPKSVNKALIKQLTAESLNKDDFNHVQNIIVGSNAIATEHAYNAAFDMGYVPFIMSTELEGQARNVGVMFSMLAEYVMLTFFGLSGKANSDQVHLEFELCKAGVSKKTLNAIVEATTKAINSNKGVCIIAGGETTVHVKGSGIGGRNLEMAVSCALKLDNLIQSSWKQKYRIEFLSCGTDGQDGPTTTAGCMVDLDFIKECEKSELDPESFLENNDTFTLLQKVKNGQYLVNTGLTGTNVMDLQVLLIGREG